MSSNVLTRLSSRSGVRNQGNMPIDGSTIQVHPSEPPVVLQFRGPSKRATYKSVKPGAGGPRLLELDHKTNLYSI